MAKTFKEELLETGKVETVEFVGGGITRVTLKSNFGNPNEGNYHSEQQSFCAWCKDAAIKFVDGATASRYASTPGGNPCRVADGTPYACNPHMERYWCM